jgi:general secretion pathway protein C
VVPVTVFLRKHFWAVNLLTITLCALFAARAVGHLVESSLDEPAPRRSAGLQPVLDPLGSQPPSSRDITAILSRNIFCSTCEKVVETVTEDKPANNEPVKTSLNLRLLATLVSDEDNAWSFAIILDPGENKSRMYAIGSRLPGEATLTDVTERRVYLQNGNRNEFLELDTEQSAVASTGIPRSEPVISMKPSGLSGMEEEVARSIRKIGEGKYEVERAALNKVLANTHLLARSARIVPSVRNGQPNGFKLYAVRPGSLYSLLGMANGDTLSAVNGHPITTPDAALEVYTKLRNASHLSISFERQGKPMTHEYTIR